MKRTDIHVGFEAYGNKWGDLIWLVRDMSRKKEGRKDYYCVLGHSRSGWWHLKYGTLKECRDYIEYEIKAVY